MAVREIALDLADRLTSTDPLRPTWERAATAVISDADDVGDFTTTVQGRGSLSMMIDPITGR